jgi:hypothetical protein
MGHTLSPKTEKFLLSLIKGVNVKWVQKVLLTKTQFF